jgi:hypothetical protein
MRFPNERGERRERERDREREREKRDREETVRKEKLKTFK